MSKVTKKQAREIQMLAEMTDEEIDTDDIPEVEDFSGAVRGLFTGP